MSFDKAQFRQLIRETLEETGMYSDAAVELLMLTAAVESNLGTYLRQTKGPAIGVFQMEPATYQDIYESWFRSRPAEFRDKVERFVEKHVGSERSAVTMGYNLKYAILMARLHYFRVKTPLPSNNTTLLAEYWKRFFNTPLGKGTVEKAVEKYRRYCI